MRASIAKLSGLALSGLLFAASFGASAQVDLHTLIARASAGRVLYSGDQLFAMRVYQDGNLLGVESFDNRYGSDPQLVNTVVRQHITESFAMIHEGQTEYAFIYIHGITDSAFQGKDLARAMFNAGHNVLSVRLSGHGDDTKNVDKITLQNWRDDVDKAVSLAHLLGKRVVISGLSTGGALAIDKAYRDRGSVDVVAGIAPAIRIENWKANVVGFLGAFDLAAKWFPRVDDQNYDQLEVRQARKSTHALGVLYQLGEEVQDEVKHRPPLEITSMIASSEADTQIDLSWVTKTIAANPGMQSLEFAKPDAPIHSGMVFDPQYVAHRVYEDQIEKVDGHPKPLPFNTLDESNPHFDVLAEKILNLIESDRRLTQRNASLATP